MSQEVSFNLSSASLKSKFSIIITNSNGTKSTTTARKKEKNLTKQHWGKKIFAGALVTKYEAK